MLQPCIQGKIKAVFRERNVPRLGSLVIYFGLEREWRHFCFSGWFREGFSFLTVCWHAEMCAGNEKLRSRCQRRARVLPAAVTDDYHRHFGTKESMFHVRYFMIWKIAVAHFEMALFLGGGGVLKWFKPLKSESHLWFARWRFRNYSLLVHNHLFLHVLRSERTSGLHSYQLFLFHLLSWPKLKCTS